jgi:hypothetical protein
LGSRDFPFFCNKIKDVGGNFTRTYNLPIFRLSKTLQCKKKLTALQTSDVMKKKKKSASGMSIKYQMF